MPEMTEFENADSLDSWKEIAVFLRRGVRTVQRWEKTEGLPVRRHRHLKRGSVLALRSEVAVWQRKRQGSERNPPGIELQAFAQLQALTARQRQLAHELKQLLASTDDLRGQWKIKPPVA